MATNEIMQKFGNKLCKLLPVSMNGEISKIIVYAKRIEDEAREDEGLRCIEIVHRLCRGEKTSIDNLREEILNELCCGGKNEDKN